MTNDYPEPRQERREKKRLAEYERMAKHGKGLAQTYKDATLRRLQGKRLRDKD